MHGTCRIHAVRRVLATAIMLACAGPAPAMAGAPEAEQAAGKGDFDRALREWLPLGLQGDALAQHALGEMYAHGRGVPQDFGAAMHWFVRSANQGFAAAQYGVATLYYFGHGVAQDERKVAQWLELAAAQGHEAAQGQLGEMYEYGRGVERNVATAARLYAAAAESGSVYAQNNLAWLYAVEGVDLVRARALILQALKTDSRNPGYLDTFGWVLFRAGEYEDALRHLSAALASDPRNSGFLERVGDTLWQLGARDDAIGKWRLGLTEASDDARVRLNRKVHFGYEPPPAGTLPGIRLKPVVDQAQRTNATAELRVAPAAPAESVSTVAAASVVKVLGVVAGSQWTAVVHDEHWGYLPLELVEFRR